MADLHIDDFYFDIGLTLSRLYASFPRRCTIYVADISGPDTPDEFGVQSERFLSCFSAMLWLRDQDYILFDSVIRQEAIDQAVLTENSFLILSSQASVQPLDAFTTEGLPSSVAEKAITNINMLRRALINQSSIEISRIVFHIMEQSRQHR